jgi:hypothetical protein
LNGAAIRTGPVRDKNGRISCGFSKLDLDEAKKKLAQLEPFPSYPGLVYVGDAIRALQTSNTGLWRLLREHKTKLVYRIGKSSNGRLCYRAYAPVAFVEKVLAERAAAERADRISIDEATEILGLTYRGVHQAMVRGELMPLPGGRRKNGVRLSRKAVEALRACREQKDTAKLNGSNRLEDTRTLARLNKISHDYMMELVKNWLRAGLLDFVRGTRPQASPLRRRYNVRLFDPDRIERLLAEQRKRGSASAAGDAPPLPTSEAKSTPTGPAKPHWDGALARLTFRDIVCADYGSKHAPRQERILTAFQEQNWPEKINDPLPVGKLPMTLYALNQKLGNAPLRFSSDGTGKGIVWQPK